MRDPVAEFGPLGFGLFTFTLTFFVTTLVSRGFTAVGLVVSVVLAFIGTALRQRGMRLAEAKKLSDG